MLKITDRTLIALTNKLNDLSTEKLYKMCELLVKLGVDEIEVSVPLIEKLGKLPEGGSYVLRIDTIMEKEKYPSFNRYIVAATEKEENVFCERKIKNVEELLALDMEVLNMEVPLEKLRICGLDDMICSEQLGLAEKKLEVLRKKMEFCPGDNYFCATALAIEWLMKGGRNVAVSFNGIGGLAKLEEVLMGAKVIMHKKIKQDLSVLPEISSCYEELTRRHIYYNKAVVGKNIFNLEAGIQLEKGENSPITYEPYKPEEVGKVRRLVIGKNSGSNAIKLKLKEKGIKVPEELIHPLLEHIRQRSMHHGRSLSDREFFGLVQEVLAQ